MFRPKPFLTLQGQDGKSKRYTLKASPFVVGSDPSDDLYVAHKDIAAHQITISGNDAGWLIQAEGHTPSYLNQQLLSVQHLRTGDRLQLADGSLTFVFTDPAEERELAARRRHDGHKPFAARIRDFGKLSPGLRTPLLILTFMFLVMGLVGWAVDRPERGLANLSVNTPETVKAVLDGGKFADGIKPRPLLQCILEAGERGRLDGWARASRSDYWTLAQKHSVGVSVEEIAADESFKAFRDSLERQFWKARNDERLGRTGHAARTYNEILVLVPDAQCAVYTLASARFNALTRVGG